MRLIFATPLHRLGINAVPVVIIEGRYPLYGFPDPEVLFLLLSELAYGGELSMDGAE